MKFSIARETLLNNLNYVQSVVEKRNSIAILSNVKLEVEGNSLVSTATDNHMSIEAKSEAFVDVAGATTVSAHKLFEIVKRLPSEAMISLELKDDGSRMQITAGKSKFSLACLDADAFPDVASVSSSVNFKLTGSQVTRLLKKAKFAASQDDTRQYLNGIFMHLKDDKLRFVATDGHRLARIEQDIPTGAEGMPGVIIPRKTIDEIAKLADKSKDLEVTVAENKIQFATEEATLTSNVIDGTFPDYERVIPTGNTLEMDVPRQSLMSAVDRVAILSHEKSRSVRFSINTNNLVISANNPDQENAQEELKITFDAEGDLNVGFNAKYVSDITNLIEGDDIQFLMKDGNSPVVVQDPQDVSSLFVLMPMRI